MLRTLGLSALEQDVYEALVPLAPVTRSELTRLAQTHGWVDDEVTAAVHRLTELDLLTETSGEPRRLVVTPPRLALDALLGARAKALAAGHQRLSALSERFSEVRAEHVDGSVRPMEVLSGREISREWPRIMGAARHEVRVFDAPPYVRDPRRGNRIEQEMIRRGVSHRVLYNRASMTLTGRAPMIAEDLQYAEEARVSDADLKVVLIDDSAAILPLEIEPTESTSLLVVREPTVLRLLAALFESHWERALPIHSATSVATGTESDLLTPLLVAGLTDKEIADHLSWSERTVRRRLRELMDGLGATTRFQAGYRAVEAGLISIEDGASR